MMDCFRLLGGMVVASCLLVQPLSARDQQAGQPGKAQMQGFEVAWNGVMDIMQANDGSGSSPQGAYKLLDGLKKIEEEYGPSNSPEVQSAMVKVYDLMMDIYQYRLPDARKLLELADSIQKRYAGTQSPEMKDFLPYARVMEARALFFLGANAEAMQICRDIRKNHYGACGAEHDYTLSALYMALLLEIRLDVWEGRLEDALNLCALGYFKAIGPAGGTTSKFYRLPFDEANNMWNTLVYEKMGKEKQADFLFRYRADALGRPPIAGQWDALEGEVWADANMLGAMNRFEEAIRMVDDMAGMMRRDGSEKGQLHTIKAMMAMSQMYDGKLGSKDRAKEVTGRIIKQYGQSEFPSVRKLVHEIERYQARRYDGFSSKQMMEQFKDDSEPDPGAILGDAFRNTIMPQPD